MKSPKCYSEFSKIHQRHSKFAPRNCRWEPYPAPRESVPGTSGAGCDSSFKSQEFPMLGHPNMNPLNIISSKQRKKNKNYIEIALRSKPNLLQSWPARSDLPKFNGWESVSLIYAPFATAIDVKCEALESLERQQTSCKQVTEGEGNVLWLAACSRSERGVWECSALPVYTDLSWLWQQY